MTIKQPKHTAIKVSHEFVLDNYNKLYIKCDKTATNTNIKLNYVTTGNSLIK